MAAATRLATDAAAVTPSDTAYIDAMGLYVGGAGDVTVTTAGGNLATFKAVPAGTILPLRLVRVMATNTTATNMTALIGK